ncbi:hypothetical protein [Micromonospora cathayae]|uniref:Uncharacterized protein n=1 Tax=Micromonospora cathayae TaxID=3028804 RepID=A0ABY7ZTC5_9ACTN|nr:hypothetical protein [Micromonospora sp. HUAS 3]WDZ85743.1 hypothetical protein PVK37_04655 [Micromonospora sp. HUAS 3]
MTRLPRSRARILAVTASLAAVSLLVTLVVLRRDDILGVALALLVVLCATVAGVAVNAARHQPAAEPAVAAPPAHRSGGLHSIDADTLESFDDPRMVAALRERHRAR